MKYYRLEPALTAISKKPAEEFGMVNTYPNEPLDSYCLIGHLHIHRFGLKTVQERVDTRFNWPYDVAQAYAIPYQEVQNLYVFWRLKYPIPTLYDNMNGFDKNVPCEARKEIMLETLKTLMLEGFVDYSIPLNKWLKTTEYVYAT